ncbi:MAG: pilus assembly protein [Anaerolineae bacterium]|nr:pilus assembly protein [Anaerolineae bacterium]
MLEVRSKRDRERGQGLVEYALILIFVAVVLIALLTILGPGISNIYQDILETL